MADRLEKQNLATDEVLVTAAYRLSFGREPESAERRDALAFLREQAERVDTQPRPPREIAFESERMPYREGRAALMQPNGMQNKFEVPNSGSLVADRFTVEAFVLLKSVYEDASVRTIAATWDGKENSPGWSLGVTGRKSRSRPQTLVLQLAGEPMEGSTGVEAVFSGLNIELNRPYFVAVSVDIANTNENGITFYSKDLSNDDEPLQVTHVAHRTTQPIRATANFTIGGRDTRLDHVWDGLIDDVRLSNSVLKPEQLLLTSESITDTTMGFWRFESTTSYHKDASPRANDIRAKIASAAAPTNARSAALVDFCHVLLNANEFLYVD